MIAIKVFTTSGKYIGMTKFIPQSSNGIWEYPLYAVLNQKEFEAGLNFHLVHLIDDQKEFVYSVGEASLGSLINGDEYSTVRIGESGNIQISVKASPPEETGIFMDMLKWVTSIAEEQMMQKIVDQVKFFFNF